MNVNILETQYNCNRLRYYVFDENKIIFKTEDLCRILNIDEPVQQPEVDLAGAVLLASSGDPDFAMWLNEKFSQYSNETLVRPSGLEWE
jgi:hypothetical protein